MMKPKCNIETAALVRMIESESRAEYARYLFETESPLSKICDSADALGPLRLKERLLFGRLKLGGEVYYSRFRPGDRVEIRKKNINVDRSEKLSDNWKVESISYPSPGNIEVIVSGLEPLESNALKEVFLFKSSSSLFNNILRRKIFEISKEEILLGRGNYSILSHDSKFKYFYEKLNPTQQSAIEYLIENNLSGTIQGPPGTGKTQLLNALIVLALQSKMKVCVTSFTHAAVDNLLSRVVSNELDQDWVRIGDQDKVRKDVYPSHVNVADFISSGFNKEINEANLIACTLHKLAYNKSAPKVDLLVIDEAGQVPIYFWPFVQRIARRVVLVGDQFQLPPVLAADHKNLPINNVFSLLIDPSTPMLETQYRMRSEIQAWSSEKFYKGKLKPHQSVASRDFFADSPAFLTDRFVVPKNFESNSSGKASQSEADFIADKIGRIIRSRGDLSDVGVICPYRAQAGVVNATLQNRFGVHEASKILVDTVERFQGQEKEAIFLSFGSSGDSQEDLCFLSDPQRLNVSVTRARSRFFCLFDNKLWMRSRNNQAEDLNEFLRWVGDGQTKIKRAA